VADGNRIRISSVPSLEVVRTWEVDASNLLLLYGVSFLDNGNKLIWMYCDRRHLYGFATNTKWFWTSRTMDHICGGEDLSFLNNRSIAVTHDGDSTVRFWKI
jgi:hypothetical protein